MVLHSKYGLMSKSLVVKNKCTKYLWWKDNLRVHEGVRGARA